MAAFEPKRDDGRPVWRVIYDHLAQEIGEGRLNVGDVIPHARLKELLTEEEIRHYYATVGKAGKELRSRNMRSLESARGIGYRFIAGVAQIEQGHGYQSRAKRSLKRGLMVMETSDRGMMNAHDRNYADRKQMTLVSIIGILKHHDDQIIKFGEEMEILKKETYTRQEATDEEIQAIKERLAELERRKREDL